MDEWIRAAATDDALVADLLLKLKHETWTLKLTVMTSTKTALGSVSSCCDLLPFRWGRRKARSRHAVMRFVQNKEFKERATRSPKTPLSWTGGCASTSVSGNAGGYEASSPICQRSTASRSKISAAYDFSKSKGVKRKKTYGELKDEECSLLHERLNLKRNLAALRVTLTDHKMTNQSLKRIKSSNVQSRRMMGSAAAHPFVRVPSSMYQGAASAGTVQDSNKLRPFSLYHAPEAKNLKPLLPDLNAFPSTNPLP